MSLGDRMFEGNLEIAKLLVNEHCEWDYSQSGVEHCVDALFSLSKVVALDSWVSNSMLSKQFVEIETQWRVLQAISCAYERCHRRDNWCDDDDFIAFRKLYREFPRVRDAVHAIEPKQEQHEDGFKRMLQSLTDEDRAIAATAKEPVRFVGYTPAEVRKVKKEEEKRRIEWEIAYAKKQAEKEAA
jgi:hypothetical protein